MGLAADRVGPYLRAIDAALWALSPGDEWVPLQRARDHLRALDPLWSGPLFGPAAIDQHSGLPAWPWMERAQALQVVARDDIDGPSPDQVALARRRDPALADRLEARARLLPWLRLHPLLESHRQVAVVRRIGATVDFRVTADRQSPDGTWTRLDFDLQVPPGAAQRGGLRLAMAEGDHRPVVVEDPGLHHLLTRHDGTALLGLQAALSDALGGQVVRLGRGRLGPFWFPGGPETTLPIPDALRGALVLHQSLEVVAGDVQQAGHLDPCLPRPVGESPPMGMKVYRERRFAVSPSRVEVARRWAAERGGAGSIVAVEPAPVARTL
jgi:hypothetical protein